MPFQKRLKFNETSDSGPYSHRILYHKILNIGKLPANSPFNCPLQNRKKLARQAKITG